MANYRLNRSGQFTVRTTGPNHCGTTDILDIKYRLIVACPGSALDARGFLFDQTRIQAWFEAQRETELSCEAYAAYCARGLYKLIRAENPGIVIGSMELALSPAPYMAEITFVWDGTTKPNVKTVEMRAQHVNAGLGFQVGLFA